MTETIGRKLLLGGDTLFCSANNVTTIRCHEVDRMNLAKCQLTSFES